MSTFSHVAIAVTAVILAAGSLPAASREFRRTFPVGTAAIVKLETYRGDISIDENENREVGLEVEVEAEAENAAAAQELIAGVSVETSAQGQQVAVSIRNPRETGLRPTWREQERTELRIRLLVPVRCDVQVGANEGIVRIGNLAGQIGVKLGRGDVSLRRIDGSVTVELEQGDLVLSRCSGAVTARLRRGQIYLGTVGGAAELTNDTGGIEVMAVRGSLRAAAQVGDIRVGFAPGLTADSKLTAAAGNIVAAFHGRTACRVEAAASWGRVSSDVSMEIEGGNVGGRSLSGRINGGGPAVVLRASGGSVTLKSGLVLVDETD
ncbi:MAG: hypothetical protein HZC55_11885 [Verrucomicrobia bacterium]|nr:hypothetical protein [Verrucomicrobiota bacterium]